MVPLSSVSRPSVLNERNGRIVEKRWVIEENFLHRQLVMRQCSLCTKF